MRKLALAFATTLAMMAAGAPSDASAMTPAGVGLRAAIDESGVTDQVYLVCTHFWSNRWHRSQKCLWVPGLPQYYYYHYHRFY
jgi:hypothetical protein